MTLSHSAHDLATKPGEMRGTGGFDRRPRRQRRPMLTALLLAVLVAVGCSQPPQTTIPPAPAAAPAAQVELPRAVLPDGFTVRLDLALTPEEIANGLMFRPSLPPDRGMLFLFTEERYPSFWMKNTLIPLDLVFLDPAGGVVDVIPDVQPCAADPCPTYSPDASALAVLELGAGGARKHGVEPGTTLLFEHVPGYPREN